MAAPATSPELSTIPSADVAAVTPSNTTRFSARPRALYIGVGGDVSIVDSGGGTIVFKNAASGSILPIAVIGVNSTGTTATDIVALY